MNDLAVSLRELGQAAKGKAIFEKVLAIRVRVLGAGHQDTLTTRGSIARCLAGMGRVDEAIAAMEEILSDRTKYLGAEHPDTLRAAKFIGEWRQRE